MTVAAVILAASPDSALADADGLPSVRRIADVAWAGGAVPIVVVAHDPDGAVAAALVGAPVTLAEPAPVERGPAGQVARGMEVAVAEVRETSAALVWPARFTWVGPETVTSLLEAHGVAPGAVLRPDHEGAVGWPVVLPVAHVGRLRAVAPDRGPGEAIEDVVAVGVESRTLALGDPGVVHDRSVARDALPPYLGPAEPAGGHVHEWGATVADEPDDSPLEGPALAPYAPAGADSEPY